VTEWRALNEVSSLIYIVLDYAVYSQHARVPRAAGTDFLGTACVILRDVAVSVSMCGFVATRSGGE
jgi:hypothetical protein